MKKSDRAVLIFIGLGIWVLAAAQIFQPSTATAKLFAKKSGTVDCGGKKHPCFIEIDPDSLIYGELREIKGRLIKIGRLLQ